MGTWGAKRKRGASLRYVPRKYSDSVLGSISKRRRDATSLAKVKSSISTMKRQLKASSQRLYYRTGLSDASAASVAGNAANYLNLMQYSGWVPTFGTDNDDAEGKQVVVKSIDIDYTVCANTERSLIDCTVYVLRLKEEAAPDILNGGNFTSGAWPVQDSDMSYIPATSLSERPGISGGHWNPKKYTVLHRKRVQLNASNGVPGFGVSTTLPQMAQAIITGTNKISGRCHLTFGKGMVIKSAASDWKATLRPLDTKNNLFFVVVTNDFSGDLETITWNANALITLDA